MKQYFKNITRSTASLLYGLKITLRHFWQARNSRLPVGIEDQTYFDQKEGIVTLQYPFQQLPVPDTGRYQLHNEIDDCIVCDKCAKVCPVNCIDIEPIRAVEEIGKTSDGTSKRIYAAKFDIDMSKCCFCGLCTVVCPTECLTMTKDYDFSVFDLKEHNFEFGDMSPVLIAEKKAEFEAYSAEKEKAKAAALGNSAVSATDDSASSRPKPAAFRPKVKKATEASGEETGKTDPPKAGKPVFKPKIKPTSAQPVGDEEENKPPAAKPVFRPKIKPVVKSAEAPANQEDRKEKPLEGVSDKPKPARPVFKPKVKPKVQGEATKRPDDDQVRSDEDTTDDQPKPKKPVFRPKIKPRKKD